MAATVNLSAPATNTSSSHLNGVLIDDQAPNKSKNAVTVNGGGTVNWVARCTSPTSMLHGAERLQVANTTCSMVIANTLTIGGNAYIEHGWLCSEAPLLRPKSSLWCNDEKARSARRRGAGILPCRRAFFTLMFAIFDLGRYAITMQSLRTLANAGARANDDQVLHTCRNS